MVLSFATRFLHSANAANKQRFEQTFPCFIATHARGVVSNRNINIILSAWDDYIRGTTPVFAPRRPLDKGYEHITSVVRAERTHVVYRYTQPPNTSSLWS
jgi:hypothetical protein